MLAQTPGFIGRRGPCYLAPLPITRLIVRPNGLGPDHRDSGRGRANTRLLEYAVTREGGQGRPEAARRGSLDGPVMVAKHNG
jgi:hypothetical protein